MCVLKLIDIFYVFRPTIRVDRSAVQQRNKHLIRLLPPPLPQCRCNCGFLITSRNSGRISVDCQCCFRCSFRFSHTGHIYICYTLITPRSDHPQQSYSAPPHSTYSRGTTATHSNRSTINSNGRNYIRVTRTIMRTSCSRSWDSIRI